MFVLGIDRISASRSAVFHVNLAWFHYLCCLTVASYSFSLLFKLTQQPGHGGAQTHETRVSLRRDRPGSAHCCSPLFVQAFSSHACFFFLTSGCCCEPTTMFHQRRAFGRDSPTQPPLLFVNLFWKLSGCWFWRRVPGTSSTETAS